VEREYVLGMSPDDVKKRAEHEFSRVSEYRSVTAPETGAAIGDMVAWSEEVPSFWPPLCTRAARVVFCFDGDGQPKLSRIEASIQVTGF
jgi:hypothetical protein